MAQRDDFRFQPGWAMPVIVDHRKPTFIAWLLGLFRKETRCLAYRQGRCPGPNLCHDCSWSSQETRPDR